MTTGIRRTLTAGLALGASATALIGCGTTRTLSGAGASFPSAIYQRWFQDLAGSGVQVNYQSVGSGAGVRQFIARTIDFGASDVPMKADELAQVKQGVVQIPMTAGAIAVAYNNKGCNLSLSQAQLVDIFLGKISNFSQLGCAARPLKVVVRSDGSGTTANFTAHLSAISPAWRNGPGQGKTIQWPVGIGAKGNEGMAAQLSQVEGSIGYVESAFVKGNLQAAALANASGEKVRPGGQREAEALSAIDLGPDLTGSNPNPAKGYPIVSFSWILLYKSGYGSRLETIRKVFGHTLSDKAQAMAPSVGYISLPPEVLSRGRAALASLTP